LQEYHVFALPTIHRINSGENISIGARQKQTGEIQEPAMRKRPILKLMIEADRKR
jgi:hypothetical protein